MFVDEPLTAKEFGHHEAQLECLYQEFKEMIDDAEPEMGEIILDSMLKAFSDIPVFVSFIERYRRGTEGS